MTDKTKDTGKGKGGWKGPKIVRLSREDRDNMIAAAHDGHAPSEAQARLTDRQETFAQAIASGSSYADAYRQAYSTDNMADNTIYRNAFHLTTDSKIAARIAQIIARTKQEQRVIAQTRQARVTRVLEGLLEHGTTENARIRAAQLLGQSVGMFDKKAGDDEEESTMSLDELERKLQALLKRQA